MKIKDKIISIITAGICAASFAAGTVPMISLCAYAADDTYTYDGEHLLTDELEYEDYEIYYENDELYSVIAKACRKSSIYNVTYGDLQKITSLNLSGMELRDVPSCIQYMTNLRTLNLSDNYLQNIITDPDSGLSKNISDLDFSGLKKLTTLNISYNYLTSVPSWYVLDSITKKYIDHNFIANADDQRSIKAQTPVYYFVNGETINITGFKNRILADITLDDGSELPTFLYDPDEPAYDTDPTEPDEEYELFIEDFGLSTSDIDDNGNIVVTTSSSYTSVTVTVRLFSSTTGDNTKAVITLYLLSGDSTSTLRARLSTLLTESASLVENNYTAKSWTNYQNARAIAEAIFDYSLSETDMLKTALEQLDVSVNSLVLGINDETKTALTALSAVGNTYTEDDYTPSSWSALQSALDKIAALLADSNSTLSSANSAITAFQNAQKNLERTKLSVPDTILKSEFEKIFGENETVSRSGVTTNGRSYKWVFSGTDITAPADFNPEISDTPSSEASILLESGRAGDYFAFSTSQSGALPGSGTLTVDVSDKFVDGTYYLYKWSTSGTLVGEITVSDGNAAIKLSEGGTYYISSNLQRFELSSDSLTINSSSHTVVVPLSAGYSASGFAKLFDYSSSITVYDTDGNAVSSADRVITGMTVSSPNGVSYTITVMGDVDFDGYVSVLDAVNILKYSISSSSSTGSVDTGSIGTENVNGNPEANANFGVGVTGINVADTDSDGSVTIRDALAVLKAAIGSK